MSSMNENGLKRDLRRDLRRELREIRVDLRVQFNNSFNSKKQEPSITERSNARPKRAASELGEQTRRYTAAKNRDLDSQLVDNMSTSSDTHTKTCKRRLEFHGK